MTHLDMQTNPVINAFLLWMQKGDKPAKYALFNWLNKRHPNTLIRYKMPLGPFLIPAHEWCFWQLGGPQNYYLDEFMPFIELINKQKSAFSFFDLGADIGTVSALINRHCDHAVQTIAFEPNQGAFSLLNHNMASCTRNGKAVNKALSNFNGMASLHTRQRTLGDHEGYIEENAQGDIQVTSLDSYIDNEKIELSSVVVLKIDVEGQEVQVVEGASNTISQAQTCIILIEIHPDVLDKFNQTPETLFNAVEAIRPVEWLVPKTGNSTLDRSRPLFSQVEKAQYDVIAVSRY